MTTAAAVRPATTSAVSDFDSGTSGGRNARIWSVGLGDRRHHETARTAVARLAALGELHLLALHRLVGDLRQEVADDVQPRALLLVGVDEVPRRPRGVRRGEHLVARPGV